MNPHRTDDAIRALGCAHHVPDTQVARWLAMDEASRGAFLELAETLKLRTGQIVAALELLEEIAVRESAPAAAILARAEIRRAAAGKGSGPARAAAFLDALRAVRFPRLKRALERVSAELSALRLPPGISVVLPKDLGSDELVVRLSARTGRDLKRLIRALGEKGPGLVRIAGILGGDDEV